MRSKLLSAGNLSAIIILSCIVNCCCLHTKDFRLFHGRKHVPIPATSRVTDINYGNSLQLRAVPQDHDGAVTERGHTARLLAAFLACYLSTSTATSAADVVTTQSMSPSILSELQVRLEKASASDTLSGVQSASADLIKQLNIAAVSTLPQLPTVELPDVGSLSSKVLQSVGDAAAATAKTMSNLFSINPVKLSEQSELLKSTVRNSIESSENAGSSIVEELREALAKIDLSLQLPTSSSFNSLDSAQIATEFKGAFSSWQFYATVVGVMVLADSKQYGKEASAVAEEQRKRIEQLTEQLQEATQGNLDYLKLQTESEALQKEVDNISEQLQSKCMEVEAVNASLNALAADMKYTLTAIDEKAQTALADSASEKAAMQQQLLSLQAEMQAMTTELEAKKAAEKSLLDELSEVQQHGEAAVAAVTSLLQLREINTSPVDIRRIPEVLAELGVALEKIEASDSTIREEERAQLQKSYEEKVSSLSAAAASAELQLAAAISEKDSELKASQSAWMLERKSLEDVIAAQLRTIAELETNVTALSAQQSKSEARITALEQHLETLKVQSVVAANIEAEEKIKAEDVDVTAATESGRSVATTFDVSTAAADELKQSKIAAFELMMNERLESAKTMTKKLSVEMREKELVFAAKEASLLMQIEELKKKFEEQSTAAPSIAATAPTATSTTAVKRTKSKPLAASAKKNKTSKASKTASADLQAMQSMSFPQLKAQNKSFLMSGLRQLGVNDINGKELDAKDISKTDLLEAAIKALNKD